jgi:hypothetical protein
VAGWYLAGIGRTVKREGEKPFNVPGISCGRELGGRRREATEYLEAAENETELANQWLWLWHPVWLCCWPYMYYYMSSAYIYLPPSCLSASLLPSLRGLLFSFGPISIFMPLCLSCCTWLSTSYYFTADLRPSLISCLFLSSIEMAGWARMK